MPRRKNPTVVLAVDFGGSSTKAFYSVSGKIGSMMMGPEVVKIPESAIATYEAQKLGSGLPENEAWVSYDNEFYAVGYLAASQLAGISRLSELKYIHATLKVLAVLWVIASREPELDGKFDLAISTLLPGSEFADRGKFERALKAALAQFETPVGTLEVKTIHFTCLPEGAGIYAAYRQQVGSAIFNETIAFFMLGYRNLSILISDRGSIGSGAKSCDLGMVKMLERVQERTSGLESDRLLTAIAQAGDEVEREVLWSVCRSRDVAQRSEEVDALVEAVVAARNEYIAMIQNWMGEVLPDRIDRIVFSGGTAQYLKTELEKIYPFTPLEWHGGVEVPQEYDFQHNGGHRFADVWGAFVRLAAVSEIAENREVQEAIHG